jgi:hypothetical protein
MKHVCLLVLLSFASSATPAADLLIEHVTVISPEQSQPLTDRNVLIRDGRIVSVGQQAVAAKADTRKVDGRGKFLTPGLMDSHVHASDSAGIPPIGDDPALVALRDAYQRQQPRSYLYFGVTQVLDLASFGDGLKRFESQRVKPDLFHCGSAPVLDGYPTAMIRRRCATRRFRSTSTSPRTPKSIRCPPVRRKPITRPKQ